jgi:hypothetical protein
MISLAVIAAASVVNDTDHFGLLSLLLLPPLFLSLSGGMSV